MISDAANPIPQMAAVAPEKLMTLIVSQWRRIEIVFILRNIQPELRHQ